MDTEAQVGNWYETDDGEVFAVLAVDKVRGIIDVRFVDGHIDQFDPETWRDLQAAEVEPLEEWHAAMDDFLSGRRPKP